MAGCHIRPCTVLLLISLLYFVTANKYAQNKKEQLADELHSLKRTHNNEKRGAFIIPRMPPPPSIGVSGHCVTWRQTHYRTFDGKIYTYDGGCTYLLIGDCVAGTFQIFIQNDADCTSRSPVCHRSVIIESGTAPRLTLRIDEGEPSAFLGEAKLNIPTEERGYLIVRAAHHTIVESGLGFILIWDGGEGFAVKLTNEDLLTGENTCGLCGKWNHNPNDELTLPDGQQTYDVRAFGAAWKTADEDITQPQCEDRAGLLQPCQLRGTDLTSNENDPAYLARAKHAFKTCNLLKQAPFDACHSVVACKPYITTCMEDMCSCGVETGEEKRGAFIMPRIGGPECLCPAFAAYAQECARQGVVIDWRTEDMCPVSCSGGMAYSICEAACSQTCASRGNGECDEDECLDGCRCPQGTYLHDGQCIQGDQCPCYFNGVEYPAGSTLQQDCNQCECVDGRWSKCTEDICDATCSAKGDPHYTTFDGTHYDFQGDCTYTLVKNCFDENNNYHIQGKNVECGRADGVTCTRAVIIEINHTLVFLKQGGVVNVDGDDVVNLPFRQGAVYLERVSSMMIKVTLSNGIKVIWDGRSRVYITVTPDHFGKTCGLCGTFNNNQQDDFLTIQGDIETDAVAFANKYKSNAGCRDVPIEEPPHPCDVFAQHEAVAEETCCKLLYDPMFTQCHPFVNPQNYYENCKFDVCSCQHTDCHCILFADYAHDCAGKGVPLIGWRQEVLTCSVECGEGMVYAECGSACQVTADTLREGLMCEDQSCVAGCRCPEMFIEKDGKCVYLSELPCARNGEEYEAGHVITHECGSCTCIDGAWVCVDVVCPTPPPCGKHEVHTDCKSACPMTCDNMGSYDGCSSALCESGCECDDGFVFDGGECIETSKCPCHHGGEKYKDGDVMETDCEKCSCHSGSWTCEQKDCSGICHVYGDPHYETFDGVKYDYQGECDYILSQSNSDNPEDYRVSAKNIKCGTSGVTCTKDITIRIGTANARTTVKLERGKQPKVTSVNGPPVQIVEMTLYTIVYTNIGLVVKWNRGTTVYIIVDERHHSKVNGLCGNFNGKKKKVPTATLR